MGRYAKVKNGRVWSVVIWDGVSDWRHEGFDVVALPQDSLVSPGWILSGNQFVDPGDDGWEPVLDEGRDA